MSAIETLSYTVGVFSDLLSPDLAECWTEQLGRQVELPEKLEIMSVTQNEMDQMRKNYSDSVKTKKIIYGRTSHEVQFYKCKYTCMLK